MPGSVTSEEVENGCLAGMLVAPGEGEAEPTKMNSFNEPKQLL